MQPATRRNSLGNRPNQYTQRHSTLTTRHIGLDKPHWESLIIGFDRTRSVYFVKNSWDEGHFLEVPHNSPTRPVLAGRCITDVAPVDAAAQWDAFWLGHWQRDHDGWRGTLRITSARPFAATYTGTDGRALPVSGGPDGGQPHVRPAGRRRCSR